MGWVVGPLPTDHEMLHPLPHQCSESLGHTGIPTADAAGKAPVGKDSSGNFSGQWSEAGLQGSLDAAMPGYRSWISPSPGGSNLRHAADLFSTVPQFLQLHNPDSNRPAPLGCGEDTQDGVCKVFSRGWPAFWLPSTQAAGLQYTPVWSQEWTKPEGSFPLAPPLLHLRLVWPHRWWSGPTAEMSPWDSFGVGGSAWGQQLVQYIHSPCCWEELC